MYLSVFITVNFSHIKIILKITVYFIKKSAFCKEEHGEIKEFSKNNSEISEIKYKYYKPIIDLEILYEK